MKTIILTLATVATLAAFASTRTDRLVDAAREAGWTETQIDRLQGLCSDYERAAEALSEFQMLSGLHPKPQPIHHITADTRDPAIQQIAKVAKEQRSRYEVLSAIVQKYDPHRTNMTARAARQSMQSKLDTARSKAIEYWTSYTNQVVQTQTYSNAVVIAQGMAQAAQAKIRQEIADLKEEKADLEEKIADSKYILLRPWLKTKLAAVEARIKALEALT